MLALGLTLLMSYIAAAYTAQSGYHWLEFYDRPEHFLLLGLLVFVIPFYLKHTGNADFAPVYRLVGALTLLIAALSLAEWGVPSYLPWEDKSIERLYEIAGLILSAGAIWLVSAIGTASSTQARSSSLFSCSRACITGGGTGCRGTCFFATIGALGIALVMVFKRVRGGWSVWRAECSHEKFVFHSRRLDRRDRESFRISARRPQPIGKPGRGSYSHAKGSAVRQSFTFRR